MPYDDAERIWKIPTRDLDGTHAGLLDYCSHSRCYGEEVTMYHTKRTWPGRPRNGCFETLFTWGDPETYFRLIGPSRALSDDHYCLRLRPENAVQWLMDEGYDLPEDLRGDVPGTERKPLTEALREVWDALYERALDAKELAIEILDDRTKADTMRKRIQALRKRGLQIREIRSFGYWRPDAPPRELAPEA